MEWAQELERERSNSQMIMFRSFPQRDGKAEPRLPDIPEWPDSQRLAFEKETLGFYLTGHPLTPYAVALQRLATTNTQRIREVADGQEIIIGGVVNALKEINTKKGDRMAFVTLEDLNGVVEVIIFSDLYKSSTLFLKSEDPIFIKGRVDAGEESIKVIASEVFPFEQAVSQLTTRVHLWVKSEGLGRQDLVAIKEILQDCRGNCPVYLHLILPEKWEAIIDMGQEWKLSSSDQLVHRMRDLLGYEAVHFQA